MKDNVSFTKWEDAVLSNFQKGNFKNTEQNQVCKYLNQILDKGSLYPPNVDETGNFLNSFIPRIVDFILSKNGVSNQIIEENNLILCNSAALFPILVGSENDQFLDCVHSLIVPDRSLYGNQKYLSQRCNLMATPLLINNIQQFLHNRTQQSLHRLYIMIHVIRSLIYHFNSMNINETISLLYQRFIYIINQTIGTLLRDINHQEVFNTFSLLEILVSNDLQHELWRNKIYFASNLIRSPFLEKQFGGIQIIQQQLQISKQSEEISNILYENKVIDYLLDHLHQQLLSDFANIFREMLNRNLIKPKHIKKLWNVISTQHSTDIKNFISAFSYILFSLPSHLHQILMESIIEENKYPEAVLHFLSHISYSLTNQESLYNALKNYYFAIKNEKKVITDTKYESLLISTICFFIPFSKSHSIQLECIQMIEKNENINYALILLQKSLDTLPKETAQKLFSTLITNYHSLSSDREAFLSLLPKILHFFSCHLNDKEFRLLMNILLPMLKENYLPAIKCMRFLYRSSIFSPDQILYLLDQFTDFPDPSFDLLSLCIFLFKQINTNNLKLNSFGSISGVDFTSKCLGIESLWKFLFKTSNNFFISWISFLYLCSSEEDAVEQYINHCMPHIQTCGSLLALEQFLHDCEDEIFNKNQAGFLLGDNYITVYLDLNHENEKNERNEKNRQAEFINFTIPKSISRYSMKKRIANFLSIASDQLEIKSSSKDFFKNGEIIQVDMIENFSYDNHSKQIKKVPSNFLIQPNNYSPLVKILQSNHPTNSSIALRILELIPPVRYYQNMLQKLEWNKIFDPSKPYRLLYFANYIATLLSTKKMEKPIFDSFVSEGFPQYFRISFLQIKELCLNESEINLMLQLATFFLSKLNTSFIVDINFEEFCNYALQQNENNLIEYLEAMKFFNPTLVSSFSTLISRTFFSDNPEISSHVIQVVKKMTFENQIILYTPLLKNPLLKRKNAKTFFDTFLHLISYSSDPISIWNVSISELYNDYTLPQDILKYSPPSSSYTDGIFSILNSLYSKFPEIFLNINSDEIQKLFDFLIDSFLFNGVKYIYPSKSLFSFLTTLSNSLSSKSSTFSDHFISNISLIIPHDIIPITNIPLSTTDEERGLTNKGATCYINATLQQLYHTNPLKDKLFSEHYEENTWTFELQKLFTELQYFPTVYVDTTGFISHWKGWDDKPINPREQQDAGEFLQMLFDRLPIAASFFKGTFITEIEGVSENFHSSTLEDFVMLQLPVHNIKTMDESLQRFLEPDLFEGRNQYQIDDGRKIDAKKYVKIHEAPPFLCIQLKRFEYNLETMTRKKINSYFDFSFVLDLTPIMEDQSCQNIYDLVGIEVHMGIASSGHYISHIKVNDKWFTFNDQMVSEVNQSDLLDMCSGGQESITVFDENLQKKINTKVEKSSNAYLLFYKKRNITEEKPQPIDAQLYGRLLLNLKQLTTLSIAQARPFSDLLLTILKHDSRPFSLDSFIQVLQIINDEVLVSISLANLDLNQEYDSNKIFGKEITTIKNNPKLLLQDPHSLCSYILHITSSTKRDVLLYLIFIAIDEAKNKNEFQCIEMLIKEILNIIDSGQIFSYFDTWTQFFKQITAVYNKNLPENVQNSLWKLIQNDYDESILDELDLSSVFDLLSGLPKPSNVSFDDLMKFSASSKHSISFARFMVPFYDPLQYSQKLLSEISLREISTIFLNVLALEKRNIVFFLQYLSDMNEYLRKSLLDEVIQRIPCFEADIAKNFCKNAESWLKYFFIIPDPNCRSSFITFIESLFPSLITPNKINSEEKKYLIDFLEKMIQSLPMLTNLMKELINQFFNEISSNLFLAIPLSDYLILLRTIIEKADLSYSLIIHGKEISTFLLSLSENEFSIKNFYLLKSAFNFLTDLIKDDEVDTFFTVGSLPDMLKAISRFQIDNNHPELVEKILHMIPKSKSELFFESDIFGYIMASGFVNPKIAQSIASIIWLKGHQNFDKVFPKIFTEFRIRKIIHINCHTFIQLLWQIMKEFPSTTNYFYYNGYYYIFWDIISRDLPYSFTFISFLKVLSIFTDNFLQNQKSISSSNSEKASLTKLFGYIIGNPSDKIINWWKTKEIRATMIYQLFKKLSGDEFGGSGLFRFALTIAKLDDQFYNKLLSLIFGDTSGFLVKVSSSYRHSASKFLFRFFEISTQLNADQILMILIREIKLLNNYQGPEIDDICNLISQKLPDCQEVNLFLECVTLVNKIFENAIHPAVFSGGSLKLAIAIAEVRTDANIDQWLQKALSMILSLISNPSQKDQKEEFRILLQFFNIINQHFNRSVKTDKQIRDYLLNIFIDDQEFILIINLCLLIN